MFNEQQQLKFMNRALWWAQKAARLQEVPIGAVVVSAEGKILAGAGNLVEKRGCQTSHAECLAITKACKRLGGWRLDGCWVFVTLEPCAMCYGLIQLSRISGLVYGAKSPLFGFTKRLLVQADPYFKCMVIKQGLKEQASAAILKEFFGRARWISKEEILMAADNKERLIVAQERLIKRKQEILRPRGEQEIVSSYGQVRDLEDQASDITADKLQRSLEETKFDELRMIDEALERIKIGEYGKCLDCQDRISDSRLDYYPYAIRCIVCQEACEG